jgi:hypothetical protein
MLAFIVPPEVDALGPVRPVWTGNTLELGHYQAGGAGQKKHSFLCQGWWDQKKAFDDGAVTDLPEFLKKALNQEEPRGHKWSRHFSVRHLKPVAGERGSVFPYVKRDDKVVLAPVWCIGASEKVKGTYVTKLVASFRVGGTLVVKGKSPTLKISGQSQSKLEELGFKSVELGVGGEADEQPVLTLVGGGLRAREQLDKVMKADSRFIVLE